MSYDARVDVHVVVILNSLLVASLVFIIPSRLHNSGPQITAE